MRSSSHLLQSASASAAMLSGGVSLVDLAVRATRGSHAKKVSGGVGPGENGAYAGVYRSQQHLTRAQHKTHSNTQKAISTPSGSPSWIDEAAEEKARVEENRSSPAYQELHRQRLASAELGLYGGEHGWQRATRDVVDPENPHLERFWIKDPIYGNLDAASYQIFRTEGFMHLDMRKLLKFSREQPIPPTVFDHWIGQRVPLDDAGCAAVLAKCHSHLVKLEGCATKHSQAFFWKVEEMFERMLVTTIPPVEVGPLAHAEFIRVCSHSNRWKEGKLVVDRALEEVNAIGPDAFRLNSAYYEAVLDLCATCEQPEFGLAQLTAGIQGGVRLTAQTLDCALYLLGGVVRKKLDGGTNSNSSNKSGAGIDQGPSNPPEAAGAVGSLSLKGLSRLANEVWALYELYGRDRSVVSFKNKIRWSASCEKLLSTLLNSSSVVEQQQLPTAFQDKELRANFIAGLPVGTFVTETIRTINEADAAEIKLDTRTFSWLLHALQGNTTFTRYVVGLVPELDARGLGTNTEVFVQLFQYAASIGSGEVALKLHSQRLGGAPKEMEGSTGGGDLAKSTRDRMTEEMLYFMLLAFTKSHQTGSSTTSSPPPLPSSAAAAAISSSKNAHELDATYVGVALDSLNVLEKHSSRIRQRQPLIYYCFLCLCARAGQVETALSFMKRYFLTLDLGTQPNKVVASAAVSAVSASSSASELETNLNTHLLTLLLVANLNAFRHKIAGNSGGAPPTPGQLSFLQSILIEVLDLWAAVDSIQGSVSSSSTEKGEEEEEENKCKGKKPSLQAVHTVLSTLGYLGDSGDLDDLLQGTSLARYVKQEDIHLFARETISGGEEGGGGVTSATTSVSSLSEGEEQEDTRTNLSIRATKRNELLQELSTTLPSLPPLPELSDLDPECLPTFTTPIHYSAEEIWLRTYGQVNPYIKRARSVDVYAAEPFKVLGKRSVDNRRLADMPWGTKPEAMERAERVIQEGEKRKSFTW